MNMFVGLQGQGDLGESLTSAEGYKLCRREETVVTKVRSIFGTHCFRQFAYSRGSHEKVELQPISARMSLPESQWSYLLQGFSQMLAVDSSYEQAMSNLGRMLCSKYSVDTAQQVNHAMGAVAQSFIEDLPAPLPESGAAILVASADWTLQGASDMLNVRALHQSDHWQSFLAQHIQIATETVHKNRDLIKNYQPIVLAC